MYIKYLRDRSSEQLQNKPAKHQKKKRAGIPTKTRSLLQKEIKSICPFCPSEDVDHFEIHHIDENPSNNIFENLLMVCPTCHSKITKEDITREQVILKKKGLSKQ
jgi:5-methylcytosine-specific restriction endonuclease McrA